MGMSFIENKFSVLGIFTSIFVFFLPFVSSDGVFYGATNAKYFYVILFIFLISLYFSGLLIAGKIHLYTWKNRWLMILSICTFIFYYISGFMGVDFERSLWSDIGRSTGLLFLSTIFLGSFILSETLSKKDWKNIFLTVSFSVTLFAIISYFGAEGFGLIQAQGITFGNSTFAGSYLLLGFIITLVNFFNTSSIKLKRTLLVFALLQFLSPILINLTAIKDIFYNPLGMFGSARASGATAIITVIYFSGILLSQKVLKIHQIKFLSAWSVAFLFVTFFGVYQLFTTNTYIQEKYIGSSTAARIIVWENSSQTVDSQPLFGWGYENFRHAFETTSDTRLYYKENIGEIWFDKAHNIFVDTLVSVGYVGAILTLLVIIYFLSIIFRAYRREIFSIEVAFMLAILPLMHFLQLQTSFDVVSTYILLSLLLSYGFYLEIETSALDEKEISRHMISKIVAGLILIISIFGFYLMFIVELDDQQSLYQITKETSFEKQTQLIDDAFDRNIDFESLRLASSSIINGLLAYLASDQVDPIVIQKGLIQANQYKSIYERYLERVPNDYRVRINYVNLLMTITFLGEDNLKRADEIIKGSYSISNNNPLTYSLDALISLYEGDLEVAKNEASEALKIDENVESSQQIYNHILEQEKSFPTISVIKLQNL